MRIFTILLLTLTFSLGEEDPLLVGPGLKIGLISENSSIAAGEPFTVGIDIKHFPGFHTYWKNPGMVGVGTSIEWTLPEGFAASGISWPYPEKSFMADYPCYGYERDVTLLITITPPEKIEQEVVSLSAKTTWMCCAKGCFPGFETFKITLPVKESAEKNTATAALFKKARSEFPTQNNDIVATLTSKPDAKIVQVHLLGLKDAKPEEMHFFSSDKQISSDKKQSFQRKEDGSITFSVPRSEFSPKETTSLPGVLLVGDSHFTIEAKAQKNVDTEK